MMSKEDYDTIILPSPKEILCANKKEKGNVTVINPDGSFIFDLDPKTFVLCEFKVLITSFGPLDMAPELDTLEPIWKEIQTLPNDIKSALRWDKIKSYVKNLL